MRSLTACLAGFALVVSACSSEIPGPDDLPAPEVAKPVATTEQTNSREGDLKAAAVGLNNAISANDAPAAWGYYSQRCQAQLGDSLETFQALMDSHYADRSPKVESVTVRVNGSSAQVVTVDNDPAAPANSMEPKTWTFIDGRWQFDNC